MAEPEKSPTFEEEAERLKKWREVRRQAAVDPQTDRLANAAMDREKRLELFEQDKSKRIRNAEDRRRSDAEALETRRMEKARVHLEALDDIETAKTRLIAARKGARRLALAAFGVCVGLPTLTTAIWFAFFAVPIFQSNSILVLPAATPIAQRNPIFNDVSPNISSSMAAAFQLRAALIGQTIDPAFEIAIDVQQGLLTFTTNSDHGVHAAAINQRLITQAKTLAPSLVTISAPTLPTQPVPRTVTNSFLIFLTSLSIFSIGAIFLQSLLHHSRN